MLHRSKQQKIKRIARMSQTNLTAFWGQFADPTKTAKAFETLQQVQRKNIEALAEASRLVLDGLQVVSRRNVELAQASYAGVGACAGDFKDVTSFNTLLAKQMGYAKSAAETVIDGAREAGTVLTKANDQAGAILANRVVASIDEMRAAVAG